MAATRAVRWLVLAASLAALPACSHHTRVETLRAGYTYRGGGSWAELNMGAIEVGPGGPRRQSVTLGATTRFLYGHEGDGRIEGAVQVRAHLWRAHRAEVRWTRTSARFDPADPSLRRVPCGDHAHVERFDAWAITEAFSAGLLVEGTMGATGRWVPAGLDARGRPHRHFTDPRVDGGVSGGVFVRYLTPAWIALSVDAGWEHSGQSGGPFLRVGAGVVLDLSIDRSTPRTRDPLSGEAIPAGSAAASGR